MTKNFCDLYSSSHNVRVVKSDCDDMDLYLQWQKKEIFNYNKAKKWKICCSWQHKLQHNYLSKLKWKQYFNPFRHATDWHPDKINTIYQNQAMLKLVTSYMVMVLHNLILKYFSSESVFSLPGLLCFIWSN